MPGTSISKEDWLIPLYLISSRGFSGRGCLGTRWFKSEEGAPCAGRRKVPGLLWVKGMGCDCYRNNGYGANSY